MIRLLISRLALPGLGLAALLGAAPAQAATTTTTIAVTATVEVTCAVTATPLPFGLYTGAQVDANATINAVCTNSTPYNVGLNAGNATGATVTTRAMTGPTPSVLNYTLSTDAAHTINWGNTVGTDTVPGTGTGLVQQLTVFGRVLGGQLVRPGAYTDTILVTLTF